MVLKKGIMVLVTGIRERENLFVDAFLQKSIFEIDEFGAEAASTSSASITFKSLPQEFR